MTYIPESQHAPVTDPTLEASAIAMLKGLLKQLQGGGIGAVPTTLSGSNLTEQKTQADAVGGVLTFAANISTIELYNTDATNAGMFVVNGIAISVPAGKVYKSGISGNPGKTVTVSGATTYIVSRYT
jgi:hypothetical protein